jgi:hypothetical protein
MKNTNTKILNEALSKLVMKFGSGCIKRTAEHYGLSRQMVSATLRGTENNPGLRRNLKQDFGVECVPWAPASIKKAKRKRAANQRGEMQKAA